MMKPSPVKMLFVGGPTLLIEWCGVRFMTDPTFDPAGGEYSIGPIVLKKTQGPAIALDQIGPLDVVLLSHDQHQDNLDTRGREVLSRSRLIYTTVTGADRLGGTAQGLAPWDKATVLTPEGGAIEITATPARHGPEGCETICGEVTGFVLQHVGHHQEGALYISGDTVWYEGVIGVARRFHVTTAVLSMGAARLKEVGPDHLTMTAADAIATAHTMPQARIVPIHYQGWAHWSEGCAEVEKEFTKAGMANRLQWLPPGHWITLT